jgi:hypothetical protein
MTTEGSEVVQKKVYTAPRLAVHGTVAEITAGTWSCDRFGKQLGYGDGFVLGIVPTASCS